MTPQEPCWVRLQGASGRFLANVKAGVRPRNRRRFVRDAWEVHWQWLPQIISWARTQYQHIDYTALPTEWQLRAAGAHFPSTESLSEANEESPFATLCVTEEAPQEVVAAAFRALAKIHHPDVGGDAHAFRRIVNAYERVQQMRLSTVCAQDVSSSA